MGEIVNMRRARKARARAEGETEAAVNRAAFGRTKTAKDAASADEGRRARMLDGAKRED